jgi:hypothetical protein
LTTAEWRTKAQEDHGIGRSKFFELRKELVDEKSVRKARDDKWERCG